MALVVLLGLATYAIVISEKGGGATFEIWRPDRMRFAVIALIVIGVAAYEFRPTTGWTAESAREDELAPAPPSIKSSEEPCADGGSDDVNRILPEDGAKAACLVKADRAIERAAAADAMAESLREELEELADAEAVWQKARELPHNFIPNEVEDEEYLKLVRRAAEIGHVLAMVKLGDYAFRRGWIVEAYYWTLVAQLRGGKGLDAALDEIRKTWTLEGHPPEYENVRPDFSETQGVFARAVLRLKCGLDAALARARLKELVDLGLPEAKLFCRITDIA